MDSTIAKLVQEMVVYGTIGAFGGTAHYVYQAARKGRAFSGWGFIANVFLAWVVGWGVVLWFDASMNRREFYSLVTGFLAYPILDTIDQNRSALMKKLRSIKGPD